MRPGGRIFPARPRLLPRGFTLVEAMVSLAIGLLVVSALVSAYAASVRDGRHVDALAQITEDATLALAVLRQQVAQAGLRLPHGSGASGPVLASFPPVGGCAARGFADLQAAIAVADNCAPAAGHGADASDALEVAYEASVLAGPSSNGILGAAGAPLDCAGNGFAPVHDAAAGDYWRADSKFYVADTSLMCHGPGNAAGAAVSQNVEVLRVTYGIAAAADGEPGAGQVAWYTAAPPPGSPLWARVAAVGVCVQMRSAARVLDATAAATLGGWTDCDGAPRSAADGYVRRAFATTIALQNRLP